MSEFSDLMTMKLIEQKRFDKHGMSDNLRLQLLESAKLVKNLNVRAPVHLIAQVEVLAQILDLSKAELVMEMLESSLREAYEMLEKEGRLDGYWEFFFKYVEENYGANLVRDENGKVVEWNLGGTGKAEE